MTVAGTIVTVLQTNWALAAPLAAANIHFDDGWYDSRAAVLDKQVIVSHIVSPPTVFFGPNYSVDNYLNLLNFDRYAVDCWVRVKRGETGVTERDQCEDIKNEVVRILNLQRGSYAAPLGLVFPLDYGTQLNEVDSNGVPYIMRWRVMVQANAKTK
jgi:hypothetical protein